MKHSILLATFLMAGCGSSEPDANTSSSPITACSARYRCSIGSEAFDASLARSDDGSCRMGEVDLRADGTAGTELTWTADAQSLKICPKTGACVTCVDVSAPKPATEGKCTGSPDSCGSSSSCSSIRGCRTATHVKYNGDYEYTCEGSPDDCDDIYSEAACHRQGCDWK
jgi:hypothetical protein